MKLNVKVVTKLKTKEVVNKMDRAFGSALKNVVVDIANDAIKGSPVATGNNRRLIKFEIGPGGDVAKDRLEGAIYSTSGYGGYLETGTVKMAARPYFKPALDKNIKNLPKNIKAELK